MQNAAAGYIVKQSVENMLNGEHLVMPAFCLPNGCGKGYFKFLWFEEADEYGGEEEIRSVEQSVLRAEEKKKFVEFLV